MAQYQLGSSTNGFYRDPQIASSSTQPQPSKDPNLNGSLRTPSSSTSSAMITEPYNNDDSSNHNDTSAAVPISLFSSSELLALDGFFDAQLGANVVKSQSPRDLASVHPPLWHSSTYLLDAMAARLPGHQYQSHQHQQSYISHSPFSSSSSSSFFDHPHSRAHPVTVRPVDRSPTSSTSDSGSSDKLRKRRREESLLKDQTEQEKRLRLQADELARCLQTRGFDPPQYTIANDMYNHGRMEKSRLSDAHPIVPDVRSRSPLPSLSASHLKERPSSEPSSTSTTSVSLSNSDRSLPTPAHGSIYPTIRIRQPTNNEVYLQQQDLEDSAVDVAIVEDDGSIGICLDAEASQPLKRFMKNQHSQQHQLESVAADVTDVDTVSVQTVKQERASPKMDPAAAHRKKLTILTTASSHPTATAGKRTASNKGKKKASIDSLATDAIDTHVKSRLDEVDTIRDHSKQLLQGPAGVSQDSPSHVYSPSKPITSSSNDDRAISPSLPLIVPSLGPNGRPLPLTAAQKKQNHILSEQKRRTAIRSAYDSLCNFVPSLRAAVEEYEERLSKVVSSTTSAAAATIEMNGPANGGPHRSLQTGIAGVLTGGIDVGGEKIDGRAGPKSEAVVLAKTVEYLRSLLEDRQDLLSRLAELCALHPDCGQHLYHRGQTLWTQRWHG